MVRMLSEGPQLFVNGKPVERATFEITREMVDVTTLPGRKPDPKWAHIDKAGHYHAFNMNGELPTLDARYADVRTFGDYEAEDVFVGWFCAICGEYVEPRYIPDGRGSFVESAPGRQMWGGEFWLPVVNGILSSGTRVSIRLPAMNRFGIAEITTAGGESTPRSIRYTYVGLGELAERLK